MVYDEDCRLTVGLGLSQEQITELSNSFETIDSNGDGVIQLNELQRAFETVGLRLPAYQVRDLIREHFPDYSVNAALTLTQFAQLFGRLKEAADPKFKDQIQKAENVHLFVSEEQGIYHSVSVGEQTAFSNWINSNLCADDDLRHLLPLRTSGDLYSKLVDGLIICKLINLAVPDTIDERAINRKNLNCYTQRENLTLALNSARAIGCNIVNIDADDLAKGKQHLVLGLLWQIIRIGLFSQINLVHVPGLFRLLNDGENISDLQRLSPEQILMRWVNYHLRQADVPQRLTNFTDDVRDSTIYTYLIKQIAPPEYGVTLEPLSLSDDMKRAEAMLREADKLQCRAFVSAHDVVMGIYKLNLAFVANLFNTWPGLKPPGQEELEEIDVVEESREEKTYRNWMNSVGVEPTVNWLYSDLCNGLVIFQLYDIVKPGTVDWKRVVTKFTKMQSMMSMIQNCNYAVELGKQVRFSLVGIQGKDIYDGNRTLTLGLVWQLMRAYTLAVLANCTQSVGTQATDKEIIDWVNGKLRASGSATTISSFQDAKISDGKLVLDLVDAIQPGIVSRELIKAGATVDEKMENAKYAISIARKIGAKIYALPEDIVECKPKMVMTVFACLMARDYVPNMSTTVNSCNY